MATKRRYISKSAAESAAEELRLMPRAKKRGDFKVGETVKVYKPPMKNGLTFNEGVIVYAHPQGIFYTVSFRNPYIRQYTEAYRESVFPERLKRADIPDYFGDKEPKKRGVICG